MKRIMLSDLEYAESLRELEVFDNLPKNALKRRKMAISGTLKRKKERSKEDERNVEKTAKH
jgi:hypothetical protein